MVPNCGIEARNEGERNGRVCKIQNIKSQSKKSVQVNGPQLFNALPASIRNMTICGIVDFKMKLDKFLENVPDKPNVRSLVPEACTAEPRPSNSFMGQVKRVQKRSHGR